MEKPTYTYDEAAELLCVSHWTIRRWVKAGKLNAASKGQVTAGSIMRFGELDAGALHGDSSSASGVREKGNTACHTSGKGRRTGGRHTPAQAARELDALLEQPI